MSKSLGSSPLARGLRVGHTIPGNIIRIIPARAGFTCGLEGASRRFQDHPRSRGVYRSSTKWSQMGRGSSPLARGLPGPGSHCFHPNRIIPARAGFTCDIDRSRMIARDHPRSRGVYRPVGVMGLALSGSSPLARGLLLAFEIREGEWRIIPARAGFTPTPWPGLSRPADHPRSRGVYGGVCYEWRGVLGSSPLARGLPESYTCPQPRTRIIPARAGFTVVCVMNGGACWDHPRSRGVYLNHIRVRSLGHGSSPLARGLRWCVL